MKTPMKRLRACFVFCLAAAFFTALYPQGAVAQDVSGDTIAAQAILVDAATGTVLLDKNANARMPTSSMSKTMTIYMVFDALKRGTLKLGDTVTISEKAWRMGGSKMFIEVGKDVKVEDLIRGVVIQSGNDASVALAEALGGSEDAFAAAMTRHAHDMGMVDSNFVNASGWPAENHYSTARDLALLAYRLIYNFPEYYHYFAEREFTYNKIRQANRDPLLGRVPGADGLKTGHTEVAGYGLIGSALRDGRRLILVVNGLKSETERRDESVRLLEWGFRNFENRTLVSKGEPIDRADVWLGTRPDVALAASEDINVVLPVGGRADIVMRMRYDGPVHAPVTKGDPVAKLFIEIPGQKPIETSLVAAEDVPRDGWFGRARTRLMYLVTGKAQ